MKRAIVYHTVPVVEFNQDGETVTLYIHKFEAKEIFLSDERTLTIRDGSGSTTIHVRLAVSDFVIIGNPDDVNSGVVSKHVS